MSELWHDFVSLWDWAAEEGSLINYVIAATITGMLLALAGAIGYAAFLGGRVCVDHVVDWRNRPPEPHLYED